MKKTVRDVMSANPIRFDCNASMADAARAMRQHDIGDVLVTENGRLLGIVTDRDIVVRGIAEGKPLNAKLGDICSEKLVTVSVDAPLETAVDLMRQHVVRRLPVIENGKPIGVVSLGDLAGVKAPESALGQISQAAPTH